MSFYKIFVFLFFVLLIPAEFFFYLGPARFEIYRIVLIIIAFILIVRKGFANFSIVEIFLLTYCLICCLSYLYNFKFGGIQSGIILSLEVFITFLVGKYAALTGSNNVSKIFKIVAFTFLFLFPFGIAEAITGTRYFHIVAAYIMDNPVLESLGYSYIRMGLHRASTVFAHPILSAVCAAAFVPLIYFNQKGFARVFCIIGLFGIIFVSVSSVAYLMVAIQILLYTIEYINRYLPFFRKYSFLLFTFALAIIQLFTKKGALLFLIMNLSFNPFTAYYRYLQWNYAWDDVINNKLFGIGDNESWSRPGWMIQSIDAYWLSAALVNGLYSTIILFIVWILVIKRVFSSYTINLDNMNLSFYLSLVSLLVGSFTVDFFDRLQPITYLLIGLAFGYSIYYGKQYDYKYKNSN